MRAVVVTEYGPPDKLEVRDMPEPAAGPNQLKIRLSATSVNPIDWKLRRGDLRQFRPLSFPAILGRDASGEVVEVGSGVTAFQRGDKVIGLVDHGYADYVVAPVEAWARAPVGLTLEDAAALPLVGLTGAQLIEEGTSAKAGEAILVTGAVGSVGRVAVFVAKTNGTQVWAGVRSDQIGEAEKLGVTSVVAIDDDRDWQKLPELDAIADTVGGPTVAKLLPKLKKNGVLGSVVGEPPGAKERGIAVHAIYAHRDPATLSRLAESMARGELVLPISHRFRFDQAAEAHRIAERGGVGKVLLIP